MRKTTLVPYASGVCGEEGFRKPDREWVSMEINVSKTKKDDFTKSY